jgi:hypothetical protein
MFEIQNVLQCNHNIISMIVLIYNFYLTLNTLLKCWKNTKPCMKQVCDETNLYEKKIVDKCSSQSNLISLINLVNILRITMLVDFACLFPCG